MSRSEDVAKRRLWGLRLQRFERSQLTVASFCELERVSVATFYHWRKRLATNMSLADDEGGSLGNGASPKTVTREASEAAKEAGLSRGSFVPVKLLHRERVEVRLGNGVLVRLPAGDVDSLRLTLEVVARLSASGELQVAGRTSNCKEAG